MNAFKYALGIAAISGLAGCYGTYSNGIVGTITVEGETFNVFESIPVPSSFGTGPDRITTLYLVQVDGRYVMCNDDGPSSADCADTVAALNAGESRWGFDRLDDWQLEDEYSDLIIGRNDPRPRPVLPGGDDGSIQWDDPDGVRTPSDTPPSEPPSEPPSGTPPT